MTMPIKETFQKVQDVNDGIYIKDVLERHGIKNDAAVLLIFLDILASGIGSLANPTKLPDTFKIVIF